MSYSEFSSRADARAQLNASIRALYEDTSVSVREIARLAGVTERSIYALVRRLKCRTRGRQPVPAKKRIDARASATCHRAARHRRKVAAVALAELKHHAAERGAQRKQEREVRLLYKITQGLRELARLDTAHASPADAHARIASKEELTLDERRRELARRIANLTKDANTANQAQTAPQAPARIRVVSD